MNVAIVSCFRNAASYIDRYCLQMARLEARLELKGHKLHLILGYGDSNDGTGEILFEQCSRRFACTLMDVSHGGAHYGSIVHADRFKQLAGVYNALWSAIVPDTGVVGLVESDLIWQPYVPLSLILSVKENQIVAPMVYHADGRFYDTYAYRRQGTNFRNERPFHPDLGRESLLEMDSVGSVLFMRYALASRLHWPEEDVVVGLCNMARERYSATVLCNTELGVYHP